MKKSTKIKIASLALVGVMALSTAPFASAAITPNTFNDVKPSDWYYSAVDHVVSHGYFNGVGANTFAPNGSMNRAMAVTVLARMFGGDLKGYTGKTPFNDVPIDAYYAKAVQWAVDKGIASGTSPTTFSPDSYATREQISVFLYNAVRAFGDLGSFSGTVLNTFSDKDRVSSWAKIALRWATSENIINGDGGQVKPQNSTTRAAFATIAMNYDNKHQGSNTAPAPTPDPDPTPDPEPTPEPDPSGYSADETALENEISSLLMSAWKANGENVPGRDTSQIAQAAKLIAQRTQPDAEAALKAVGFDRPVGEVAANEYTTSTYRVRAYTCTVQTYEGSSKAVAKLKSNESLMNTSWFTDYAVSCSKTDAFKFTVTVLVYDSEPTTIIDYDEQQKEEKRAWLAEHKQELSYIANLVNLTCEPGFEDLEDGVLIQLYDVPSPILEKFSDSGWKFVIGDSKKLEDYAGVTIYQQKEIFAWTGQSSTPIHEFGHFLHGVLNFPPVIETYYKQEGTSVTALVGNYANKNHHEFFAECFRYYIRNQQSPDRLAKLESAAPQMYAYLKQLEVNGWVS